MLLKSVDDSFSYGRFFTIFTCGQSLFGSSSFCLILSNSHHKTDIVDECLYRSRAFADWLNRCGGNAVLPWFDYSKLTGQDGGGDVDGYKLSQCLSDILAIFPPFLIGIFIICKDCDFLLFLLVFCELCKNIEQGLSWSLADVQEVGEYVIKCCLNWEVICILPQTSRFNLNQILFTLNSELGYKYNALAFKYSNFKKIFMYFIQIPESKSHLKLRVPCVH